MIHFLLYLFESGLCLSILYLTYALFFRHETFFNFNRFYLVSIVILALLLPVLHLKIKLENRNGFSQQFEQVKKVKSYYEQLIAYADPDYYTINQNRYERFDFDEFSFDGANTETHSNKNIKVLDNQVIVSNQEEGIKKHWNVSIYKAIISIYFCGILFFAIRFFILLHWLLQLIRHNKRETHNGITIVFLKEKMPPFSFFRYVFINPNILKNNEYEQILAHEKVHALHRHSLDLIIAHFVTVLQWFNPVVWFVQKAIKTNHEYIADSVVIGKGYELYDYQSLLLSQLISIRSVELVNNFNLVSIKKRITMMNKMKSGFAAKMKALLIIPAAFFLFLFFAETTVNGTENATTKGSPMVNLNFQVKKQLSGLWVNQNSTENEKYLLFEDSKLNVVGSDNMLKDFDINIDNQNIELMFSPDQRTKVKYKLSGNTLKINWTANKQSVYVKSKKDNTFDDLISKKTPGLTPVEIKNFNLVERSNFVIDFTLLNKQITVNGKKGRLQNCEQMLKDAKQTYSALDLPYLTVKLTIDGNTKMKDVSVVFSTLRKLSLLKLAHSGRVPYNELSPALMHIAALPKRMPPLGVEELEVEKVRKQGFGVFIMEIYKPSTNLLSSKQTVKKTVTSGKKYILSLRHNNDNDYKTYMSYVDMVYSVIFDLREEYAQKHYKQAYKDLSMDLQKKVKKVYPLVLSEANVDVD